LVNVTVDDECPSVVSAGSRATLADFYDRALAGSRLGARSLRNSPWPYPSAVPVGKRPRSVAALRADAEVSALTSRSVLRPVPVRSSEEENAIPPTSRPASQGSKASQGSRASRLSECVGQIGTIAGVVQDMLAAQREDNERRQADSDNRKQVQLQMMLAHREETELWLIEARESADKQMRLLQEMHETAARCRELETEKSVRREVEEHQVSLAWINSGRAERGRQRSVVQRELERQRPGSVARGGFAESPPSTRASTPSPPQAFVYDSERDNDAAIVVSCARPSAIQLATIEQSADSIEPPRVDRPSSEPESIHPVQLSMMHTSADVTVASTPKAAVASDGAGNPSVIPPGYMLIPIPPLHSASVGAGVGVSAVPGLTPGPTTVGMGVSSVEMAPVPAPNAVFIGDNPATSAFVCVANSASARSAASVGGCLIASEPARSAPPVVNPQASVVPVGGVVMSTLPITASVGLGGNVGLVNSSVPLTATSAAPVTDAQPSVSSPSVTTFTSTATTSTPSVAPTLVVNSFNPSVRLMVLLHGVRSGNNTPVLPELTVGSLKRTWSSI